MISKVASTQKELTENYKRLIERYKRREQITELIEICQPLWKQHTFKTRKGNTEVAFTHPSKKEVEKKVGAELLEIGGTDLDEFYTYYLGIDEHIRNYPPTAEEHHFFWGDSCYGFGGTQQENDEGRPTNEVYFPYYFAYGGPCIYLGFTVKVNDEGFDLSEIEYCEAWAMQGGHIDITDDPDAIELYEYEFAERIGDYLQEMKETGNFDTPEEIR